MAWVSTSPLVKTYTLEEFWELCGCTLESAALGISDKDKRQGHSLFSSGRNRSGAK